MQVTIKDVARMAGVAPSTVSRVIANSPKISDATKALVLEAMEELNYRPNIIARSLANRKTYTLGLILPTKSEEIFDNPFFIQTMKGLSQYAQQCGYYIMYNYCRDIEDEIKTAETFIHSKWVDGIILLTSRIGDPCINFLIENRHPFVVIGHPEKYTDETLWVDNDNKDAMFEVVRSLVKQGHRKIAFISGEQTFTVNKHRFEGYIKALNYSGIDYDPNLFIEIEATEEEAYEQMKARLKTMIPEAVVGTDDTVAYGAYKAIIDKGYKGVAAVGFNNTPMAVYKTPKLSSVDINSEQLGIEAARLLIASLNGEKIREKHIIIDTSFIERDSTLLNIRNSFL